MFFLMIMAAACTDTREPIKTNVEPITETEPSYYAVEHGNQTERERRQITALLPNIVGGFGKLLPFIEIAGKALIKHVIPSLHKLHGHQAWNGVSSSEAYKDQWQKSRVFPGFLASEELRQFQERITAWISQVRTKSATKTGLILKLISDSMEKSQEALKKNEDDDEEARRHIWIATFALMGLVAAGGFIKIFQSIQKKCNGKKKLL